LDNNKLFDITQHNHNTQYKTMKICAACCNELPQSNFSKKQWKLKQYERRCTDCIAANRELQLKPPPKTNVVKEDDTPTCYICLDDGPDELGGEVMRDCSCRGSAGYVHLSCAVKYAEQKYMSDAKREKIPGTPAQIVTSITGTTCQLVCQRSMLHLWREITHEITGRFWLHKLLDLNL